MLVVFVTLLSFTLGMYGVVQTAILHSIGARTYAFETFRQRTNLSYLREDGTGLSKSTSYNYSKKGWRYHGVQHESDARPSFVATVRPISFGTTTPPGDNTDPTNNQGVYQILPRNQKVSTNPAWIMVGYGICMTAQCGNGN